MFFINLLVVERAYPEMCNSPEPDLHLHGLFFRLER
jgi:hypothetical protein